jgi:hypothetical protein
VELVLLDMIGGAALLLAREPNRGRADVGDKTRPNGEVTENMMLFHFSCMTWKRR